HLADLRQVRAALQTSDLPTKRLVLQTTAALQPSYSRDDLEVLQTLVAEIPGLFSRDVQVKSRWGLLGGEKKQWVCECGKGVDASETRCSSCGRDRLGFMASEVTPQAAVAALRKQFDALSVLLSDGGRLPVA